MKQRVDVKIVALMELVPAEKDMIEASTMECAQKLWDDIVDWKSMLDKFNNVRDISI
jgi:hypothetical protein